MRRSLILVAALAACGGGSSTPTIDASFAPCTPAVGTSVDLEQVASGLTKPVFLTSAPGDGRLYVVEQPGRIRIVDSSGAHDPPFLDIEDQVLDTGGEQGLLGLAFHPDYANNGKFYVDYTRPGPTTVIAEYTRDPTNPDLAVPTERVVLTVDQPYSNHNGGMLAFGPDGNLYIGLGDGGSGNDPDGNGQNTSTLLGAILRIDVDGEAPYAVPDGNPFAAGGGAPEIWSYGWRNPWRFSFDRMTGHLYVGDVGQGAWEEVDVEPAGTPGGANYGWNTMEGNHCRGGGTCDMTGLVLPVAEYDHSADKCSVTGGYVYRGACMPDLQGTYFYADYCTKQVWTLRYPDATTPVEVTDDLGSAALGGISSFGEDEAGELYIVALNGSVYRIVSQAP